MARDEKLERARPRSVGMFGFVEGLNTRFLVGIQPPSPKAMATSTNDLVPRFVGKFNYSDGLPPNRNGLPNFFRAVLGHITTIRSVSALHDGRSGVFWHRWPSGCHQ